MGKELPMVYVICFKEPTKRNLLLEDGQCTGRDSNRTPPEYKSVGLLLESSRNVVKNCDEI
jgi:hypothetical protein